MKTGKTNRFWLQMSAKARTVLQEPRNLMQRGIAISAVFSSYTTARDISV